MRRTTMAMFEQFRRISVGDRSAGVSSSWNLREVLQVLDGWLMPGKNAAAWDNVGLLVGLDMGLNEKVVNKILLCNDLTLAVAEEAVSERADLIITYHPLIFKAIKSIGYSNWNERVVAKCIANHIAVYCPHTALDSVPGGINDAYAVILGNLGNGLTDVRPITSPFSKPLPRVTLTGHPNALSTSAKRSCLNKSLMIALNVHNVYTVGEMLGGEAIVTVAAESDLVLANTIPEFQSESIRVSGMEECYPNDSATCLGRFWPGDGRVVFLKCPVLLSEVIEALKSELKVGYVQVAGCIEDRDVTSFAICAGAGGSLVNKLPENMDVYITGELPHHSILEFVSKPGRSLILLGHCNSERFFLNKLSIILKILLRRDSTPDIYISKSDRSPLSLM